MVLNGYILLRIPLFRIELDFFPDWENLCFGDASILHDGNVSGA